MECVKKAINLFQKKLVSYYGDDRVTTNEYVFGQKLIDEVKKDLKDVVERTYTKEEVLDLILKNYDDKKKELEELFS